MNKHECTTRLNELKSESQEHISKILPLIRRIKKDGMERVEDYLKKALRAAQNEAARDNGSQETK